MGYIRTTLNMINNIYKFDFFSLSKTVVVSFAVEIYWGILQY